MPISVNYLKSSNAALNFKQKLDLKNLSNFKTVGILAFSGAKLPPLKKQCATLFLVQCSGAKVF